MRYFFAQPLPLGHVAVHGDVPDQRPDRIADGRGASVDDQETAVAVVLEDPVLQGSFPAELREVLLPFRLGGDGSRHLTGEPADRLLRSPAIEVFGRAVPGRDAKIRIGRDHGVVDPVEEKCVEGVLSFYPLCLGHVVPDRKGPLGSAVASDRGGGDQHGDH